MRIALTVVALLTILVEVTPPAHANEDPESLIHQGILLRRAGNDGAAFGYFERAYVVAHTPRSAAQLGLVELALQRYLDANTHLSEALSENDPWVNGNRTVLDESRTAARNGLGALRLVNAPAASLVAVNGRAAVKLPPDSTVWVTPGDVSIEVVVPDTKPARTFSARLGWVQAMTMKAVEVVFPLEQSRVYSLSDSRGRAAGGDPEPASPPGDRGSRVRRTAGVVVAGTGLAASAAGLVLYEVGRSKLEAIKRDAGSGRPYNTANGNYETLGTAGIVLMAIGAGAVATGTVLYLLNRNTEANIGVAYVPGTGGQLSWRGRF